MALGRGLIESGSARVRSPHGSIIRGVLTLLLILAMVAVDIPLSARCLFGSCATRCRCESTLHGATAGRESCCSSAPSGRSARDASVSPRSGCRCSSSNDGSLDGLLSKSSASSPTASLVTGDYRVSTSPPVGVSHEIVGRRRSPHRRSAHRLQHVLRI